MNRKFLTIQQNRQNVLLFHETIPHHSELNLHISAQSDTVIIKLIKYVNEALGDYRKISCF
jgi:hypothetical protein